MCYLVCGMEHIKDPLLLIGKSSPCSGRSSCLVVLLLFLFVFLFFVCVFFLGGGVAVL